MLLEADNDKRYDQVSHINTSCLSKMHRTKPQKRTDATLAA